MHITFDHFFKFQSLCINVCYNDTLALVARVINEEFNAIYRTWVAYTEGVIRGIMWRNVTCTHISYVGFLMPNNNNYVCIIYIIYMHMFTVYTYIYIYIYIYI